jgi:outer membrane protein TolC
MTALLSQIRTLGGLFIAACLLIGFASRMQGQTTNTAPVMDWASFRQLVRAQHPLARRADLFNEMARADFLKSKGGFDLKSYADVTGKTFKGNNYFQYTEAGLKLPTWLGLELKGAYNTASGIYLSPEGTLPADGQAQLGLRWTLGQGLMIDQRRADLRQGRIGLEIGAAERRQALNELLLDAAKSYWTWVAADNSVKVIEEALRQAQIRFEGIRESYIQGDKPAIDTLEAFIQVQNRQIDLNFAVVDRQNAALMLCNFLWFNDNLSYQPAQLTAAPVIWVSGDIRPVIDETAMAALSRQALQQYPELNIYDAKLRQLEVERRLKLEKRKPVLDMEYNLLGSGWAFFPSTGIEGPDILVNDVKWGINFSYPLPNRKARGDYQITQIKIAQTNLFVRQKQQDVQNKVRQYANDLNTLRGQIELYRQITDNYRNLLDAENEKFRFGESSIFLINTREQRWLDAQIKLIKLISEYRKAEAGLDWSMGILGD